MTQTQEVTKDKKGEDIVAEVREKYGQIAETKGGCCAPSCCGGSTEEKLSLHLGYEKEALEKIPDGADLGLGCGAPIALLDLQPGETVLDLGSGAGIDAFLAAREVGPTGKVIGVDMTPQMLERARKNAAAGGHFNVEFREGRLEALPVVDASVDAITSNCVINLVPEKSAVFSEVARVLKPGGRMVVADIVLDRPLPEPLAKDLAGWVGCVSGALPRVEYIRLVEAAGLTGIEVLKDIDQGAALEAMAPDQVRELLDRSGVRREELVGAVRSVTFRAVKPSS